MKQSEKTEKKSKSKNHQRPAAEKRLERTPDASAVIMGNTFEEIAHELKVHQIELEMQNEELVRARLALEKSCEKFMDLYDFAPVGYFTLDNKTKILEGNLTGAALLGIPRGKLINHGFGYFIVPEDLELWDHHFTSVVSGGGKHNCELALKRKDGSIFHVRLESIRVEQLDKQSEKCDWNPVIRIAVSDITEQKKIQDELRESEEKYRTERSKLKSILDSMKDGVYVANRNYDVEYVNPMIEKDFGSVNGQKCHKYFHGLEEKCPWCQNENILKEKSLVWEWKSPKTDKTYELFNTTINNPDLSRSKIVGVIRDITERKKAEDEIRAAKDYINSVINKIGDPIFVKDARHRFVLVNDALSALTGVSHENLLGKTDNDFFPKEQVAVFWKMDDIVMETGEENINEETITNAGIGKLRTVITRKTRYVDPAGNHFIVGVIRDVTDLKNSEKERLELERQLLHSQKLESLGILAGGIAHDFNNLLMAILGNLDLALTDLSQVSTARPRIENALIATKRASDLTRQMLAYSGKGHFFVKKISLNEVVEENIHILRTAIPANIMLNMQLGSDLPRILADAGQIQQVVMNLITNASEAIGEKAGIVTLSTGIQECNDEYLDASGTHVKPPAGYYVFLEVSDMGCGMDKITMHKMFDPFFSTKFTGRGLGMSGVLGIIEGHKGAILVNSEVDAGTTIRVLFPILDWAHIRDETATSSGAKSDNMVIQSALSGTILVVDDEQIIRNVCAESVEHFGLQTIKAIDGEDAVEIFREKSDEIVCVILDLMMPNMDGVAAFSELRRIKPDIKVILSSGYDKEEAIKRFAGKGLAGFIQKPYRIADLRVELERVIRA